MIENCHHEKDIELNFKNVPCCLKHLLIMNKISEEYLLSDKFGKFVLRTFKNIFEKEKIFIKCNSKINNNFLSEFLSMISKYMSHYYFNNKTNLAKYLCKIAFNYYSQELNYNKTKSKEINNIKSNLSCVYYKEKRNDKAFDIIKEFSNINNNSISDDNLIYLNNYIYLYIKSRQKIGKEIIGKINLLKTTINQKLTQIIQMSKIYDNKTSINKSKRDINIQEINLYLFIYFNYCNVYSKINNDNKNHLSNYKKGYELCLIYLGENHHLSIKYKTIINNSVLNKVHHKKLVINKNEINYKINEINSRLDKIGKSILPVKKIISNYKHNKIHLEENKNYFTEKNSRTQLISKDIIKIKDEKKEEEKNEENIDNKSDNSENQIKIEFPKISIKLNEENNDDLVCNTLYQEFDYNENETEIKKEEEEIPKISIPQINVNLDNTNNDDYTCETFFIPIDEPENEEKKEEKPKKDNNVFSLSLNIPQENNSSDKIDLSDNQLSNQDLLNKYFIDLKFYHEPFENIYNTKNDLFDISNFLTDLKENKKNNDSIKLNYKSRIFNNSNFIIKLEILPNFNIRLFLIDKNNKNDEILSTQYSFKKLLGLYKIIRYDLCLHSRQSYFDYNSYNEYITKTFLNFITINKENDQYKFKMAKKPLGLCHSSVIINLYFSKVVFDIMVINQNYCKIILSSENDDFNSMVLDTYLDEESFDMLINKELIENKYEIYTLKNNDLNNNEFLLDIIKNLQKCINGYCSGVVNVFDDMYQKANSNQKKLKELIVFKVDIKNKFKNMKLSVCEFDNKICKIITIDENLKKNKGIIYRYQISELFGYETSDIWTKLISYQKLIFAQIILYSASFNEEKSIMAIDKHQILDEINFVFQNKVCNFCMIKLDEIIYIKFMLYESIGTFEFTKIIFMKSQKYKFSEIKLKDIKDKLLDEVNKGIEAIKNGDDSLFSYLYID